MTWTDPTDPTAGVTAFTAAREKTNIIDNLRAIAEYTTYSPTVTQSGTVTKTDTYCKYKSYGGTLEVVGYLTVTGSGSSGNAITVTLPSGITFINSTPLIIGVGRLFDASGPASYPVLVQVLTTTTVAFLRSDIASPSNYAGVDPAFGLAVGDTIAFSFSAERS